jgi:predicted RNA-binding Zn-ribbon protein involved in translation (DUF1610 family)
VLLGLCIACKEPAYFLKKANSYNIFHCPQCGLQFCNPMPTREELDHYYQTYKDFRAEPAVVKLNAARNLAMLRKKIPLNKDSQILDYGCGENLFIKKCRDQGYVNSFGFDRYAKSGDKFLSSWDTCCLKKWDLITLWGVLEHLIYPIETLKHLSSLITPGGHIALTTVCTETNLPYQHKPPEHTLYFSEKSLELFGNAAGCHVFDYANYVMVQSSAVYLSILLKAVPERYKKKITHSLDPYVKVPTNEVCVIYSCK